MNYSHIISELNEIPAIIQKEFDITKNLNLKINKEDINITSLSRESNILKINGKTFLFANVFEENLFKSIKTPTDLIDFIKIFAKMTDQISSKSLFDIHVYDVSLIMSKKKNIDRFLSEDKIKPDYIIQSNEQIHVDVAQDHSEIIIKDGCEIKPVSEPDIKNIINAELVNSLFIVKISRHRKLNIRQMMIILRGLNEKKVVKVLDITTNDEMLSVTLYVEKRNIPKIFSYHTIERNQPVNIQDLSSLFN